MLGAALVSAINTTGCGGGNRNNSDNTDDDSTTDPADPANRIIVIGAGLAGLAAASELQKQGHDVLVLEARDRIGGRIHTSRYLTDKWGDVPVDLGATWIHGIDGNPLTRLADSIQAQRLVTSYDKSVAYNTEGDELSRAEEQLLDELRDEVYDAIETAQNGNTDRSIRQAIRSVINQYDESSEEYRLINFILSAELEQEYSGDSSKLSSHWYDNTKEFGGDDALFAQGFDSITELLADGLKIETGRIVTEIQWQQSPVKVLTQSGEFRAKQVIVTLPLGVLKAKRVQFTPELPANKQSAITALGMGVLNKCYLRFPTVFWPDDVDWLEYVPEQHGAWSEWVSFKRVADNPVLLGFNSGERGQAIESWSDQQIIEDAMATLKIIFGAQIPAPVDYLITRWAADPYALGSYSFNALGSTPAMRKTLAASLGDKLFFAGEASEQNYFGTAHGAYLSGLRVAEEVMAL